MKSEKFALQFDPALIPSLVNQYMMTGNWSEKDAAMEAAGQRIVGGQRTRANLGDIYRWKSARSVGHLSRNEDTDIDRALWQWWKNKAGLIRHVCNYASEYATCVTTKRASRMLFKPLNSLLLLKIMHRRH